MAEHWRAGDEQYDMDYDPLRLAVMTIWAKDTEKNLQANLNRPLWKEGIAFNAAVLNFNTGSELLASRRRLPSWWCGAGVNIAGRNGLPGSIAG